MMHLVVKAVIDSDTMEEFPAPRLIHLVGLVGLNEHAIGRVKVTMNQTPRSILRHPSSKDFEATLNHLNVDVC